MKERFTVQEPYFINSQELLGWADCFPWNDARPIDSLAAALFVNCNDPETRLMAMFTAYFDASGNSLDQPFVIVSGYVANFLQWKTFEAEWARCHAIFNVSMPFHMATFVAACERPTYKNQKNARSDYVEISKDLNRAAAFLKQLAGIQVSYVHCGISCIVRMDVYNGISSLLKLGDVVPPYALGARMCINRLRRWEKEFGIPPTEIIFESGDCEQGKLTHLMVDEGDNPPIYKNKNDFAGLQGADQYAWEQFSYLKGVQQRGQRNPRLSFSWLLESIPKLHTYPTQALLIKLCENKGIDPRTGFRK